MFIFFCSCVRIATSDNRHAYVCIYYHLFLPLKRYQQFGIFVFQQLFPHQRYSIDTEIRKHFRISNTFARTSFYPRSWKIKIHDIVRRMCFLRFTCGTHRTFGNFPDGGDIKQKHVIVWLRAAFETLRSTYRGNENIIIIVLRSPVALVRSPVLSLCHAPARTRVQRAARTHARTHTVVSRIRCVVCSSLQGLLRLMPFRDASQSN